MKKLFKLSLLAMLAVWTVSCDNGPDDNGNGNGNTPIPDGKAAFTAFGFYAEDNEGVLTEDYIAEKVESRMVLRLPKAVDRTALVARFTTLDDNEVYIGEALQESGKTANDFTNYVDYVIKQPNTTGIATYEVKAGKILEMKLEHLASYTTTEHKISDLFASAINPKDNSYYIFYQSEDDVKGGYVIRWDGTAFQPVGTGAATPAGVTSVNLSFDIDGVPYILFINSNRKTEDGSTSDNTTNGYLSMRKYLGGEWVEVGGDLVSTTGKPYKSNISFAIDPATKNPVVGVRNNSRPPAVSVPQKDLAIHYYSGTGWDDNNPMPYVSGVITAVDVVARDGDLYLGCYVQATKKYFAYRYKGNKGWDNIIPAEGIGLNQSEGTIVSTHLRVDSKKNIYFITATDENTGTWKSVLVYYNTETGTLDPIGGDILTPNRYTNTMFTFDGKDNPVLFYKDDRYVTPKLCPLDPNTKQWSTPIEVSDKIASEIDIVTDSNGDSYLSFTYELPDKVDGDTTISQGYCIETYTFALEEDEE